MIITWNGEGCFRLQSGEAVLLTDLPDQTSGLTAPRGKASVYLKTLTPWSDSEFEKKSREHENSDITIFGAGEYDVRGMKIKGYELTDESSKNFFKTIYTISWDDVSIGLLGHVSNSIPPAMLEDFEEIDVLIGPAGGSPFIEQKEMIKLVKLLNPKVYIPSFYKIQGLKRKAEDAKEILEALNGEISNREEKFVFKKKDLIEIKKTKMICLKV